MPQETLFHENNIKTDSVLEHMLKLFIAFQLLGCFITSNEIPI